LQRRYSKVQRCDILSSRRVRLSICCYRPCCVLHDAMPSDKPAANRVAAAVRTPQCYFSWRAACRGKSRKMKTRARYARGKDISRAARRRRHVAARVPARVAAPAFDATPAAPRRS
jgi:hypothetical protein